MTARIWLSFLIVAISSSCTRGEDFRVETDVFVGDEKQPVSETITLFTGGVVYDFLLTEPRETAVFDIQRGRIVLLDSQQRKKTTVTTDELLQFAAALRTRASQTERQALFGTEFAGQVDEEANEIVLQGDNLTYQAKGQQPRKAAAANRYREFADWYARLNAIRPGNPPPFGRLELNRRLADQGLVPETIARTLNLPGQLRDARRRAKSRHIFTWLLSTTDRKRIEEAGTSMANFESVTLREYWGLADVAAKVR